MLDLLHHLLLNDHGEWSLLISAAVDGLPYVRTLLGRLR